VCLPFQFKSMGRKVVFNWGIGFAFVILLLGPRNVAQALSGK
jgi:hypothetical protein